MLTDTRGASSLLGYTSEGRWLAALHKHLRHLLPYLHQHSGYNKRLARNSLIPGALHDLACARRQLAR